MWIVLVVLWTGHSDWNSVGIFPVYLGMPLIFTDFNVAHGWDPLPVEKSMNIRAILRYTGKIPM